MQINSIEHTQLSRNPIALSRDEALLVHYYTKYLSRWFDCTDAARHFALIVPKKVTQCPILRFAIQAFAACQRQEDDIAEAMYERCISLLIDRLHNEYDGQSETLLSAIVILNYFQQLSIDSNAILYNKPHLAGCSAILRASQGPEFVNPSISSLRDAAFWVYVRQCLYDATITQQPLDIDFSLQLHLIPPSLHEANGLAQSGLEAAWANKIIWNTACIANECFQGGRRLVKRALVSQRWEELWDVVQTWHRERPIGFNPIWSGAPLEGFPEILFAADWHALSFCFYHFSCILLLLYRSDSLFAVRQIQDGRQASKILDHARDICGACNSSPENVQLLLVLASTVFLWGPLLQDSQEKNEVLCLLLKLEQLHSWPTMGIIHELKTQWA